MESEEDRELERIRRAKLQEMMKESKTWEKEETVLNKPIEVTDATFEESEAAIKFCEENSIDVVHGVCVMVERRNRVFKGDVS